MKRSALALGASVIALALTAGPAAAEPGQTVESSTGAAQVGAVAVDAPVRVASDGDSATAGASAGGPQATGGSTGAAQVTSVDANAPVRVLSDGDDAHATGATGTAGPEQSVGDSSGSAQAGSPNVDAPVRVLSDGDNSSGGGAGTGLTAGPHTVDGSTGSAQVGSPAVFAPVRVLSGGVVPGDEPDGPDAADAVGGLVGALLGSPLGGDDGGDVVSVSAAVAPTAPGGRGSPSPEELSRLVDGSDPDPALRFASGGIGTGSGGGDLQALGVSAAGLPFTGFGFAALMAMGLWLLSSGLALRLVPGGRRR